MNKLTIASLLLAVWSHQTIADDEHVSITPPGETFSTTPEEVAKRSFFVDDGDDLEEEMSPKFTRSAPDGFSKADQKKILKAHNSLRLRVQPSSSDMSEMLWSSKLAIQAQRWSDGCVYEHPNKTIHTDYIGVGQNLYIKWQDEGGRRRPDAAEPVQLWYDEVKDFDYPQNACRRGAVCGHFTQVVWAETTKVGCGITFCPLATGHGGDEYENAWLVTCNYSPAGNMRGQKPYIQGEHCAACPSGFCRKELCSKCKKGEKGCECNLNCQNCGTLNRKKCKCSCVDGYYGPACENRCEDTDARCGGNPGWPKFWCNNPSFSFVTDKCPALCGACVKARGRPRC